MFVCCVRVHVRVRVCVGMSVGVVWLWLCVCGCVSVCGCVCVLCSRVCLESITYQLHEIHNSCFIFLGISIEALNFSIDIEAWKYIS